MAKKNKSKYQEKAEASESSLDQNDEAGFEEQDEESAPAEIDWNLHDAARQMVVGFKEQWWPSIRKMADSEALGESAKEDQCRTLFLKWGAKLTTPN